MPVEPSNAAAAAVPPAVPLQEQLADVHCHVLPGLDDGPETAEQSVALCRTLVREGVSTVIATPHQLGRFDGRTTAARVRQATAELQSRLDLARVPLRVLPGGEVRLDERIPRLLADDQILTLGDAGQYLLLELPSSVPFDPQAVRARVGGCGARMVLAHPERYDALRADGMAARWRDAGFLLQVNTSSLVGGWGSTAQAAAWTLIADGLASVVASDAHGLGERRPRWTEALEQIAARFGEPAMRRLCVEAPRKILAGEPID